MKLKHFWSAAAVIWGCIALGHDHETGGGDLEISCPVGPCSMECQAYGRCLVECLTGGICPSEGDTTCPTERRLWMLCLEDNQTTIPPGPFGGIIIGGPVTPPSNECGDDEIGGGSEECTKCGPGKVPNEDGTECVDCDHGEFEAGECASLCSNAELDSAAALSLGGIPREPWERLESYTCDSAGHMHIKWLGSSQNDRNVCEVRAGGSPASSAYGHSHPHFEYPRDKSLYCFERRISSASVASEINRENRKFSGKDKSGARSRDKPLYLVVPERDKVKVYRKTGRTGFWGGDVWDVETVR